MSAFIDDIACKGLWTTVMHYMKTMQNVPFDEFPSYKNHLAVQTYIPIIFTKPVFTFMCIRVILSTTKNVDDNVSNLFS